MKGVVVYDTYFGNTRLVAEAIAEQIRADGHEAEVRSVRERYPSPPQGDFMFVGGPIRMAHLSRRTRKYVKKIDSSAWKGKPIVVYATALPPPPETASEKVKESANKWMLRAAPELREMARKRGLDAHEEVMLATVKDMKGPLADGQIDYVKKWTHEYLAKIGKLPPPP